MFAIVAPPLKRGRRTRKSSAARLAGGENAPGSKILLWESFAGSVKATHKHSLEWMGSENKLSWLVNTTFDDADGAVIGPSSSGGKISLLKGGLNEPVKPAQP